MTDHAKTITILRAVADLLEARPDLNAPYLTFHFHLESGKDYDPAATAAEIAATFPGLTWETRTQDQGSDRGTTYLQARHAFPLSVVIGAPSEAFGTQAGQRVITEWEPVPVIAAILAGSKDGDNA